MNVIDLDDPILLSSVRTSDDIKNDDDDDNLEENREWENTTVKE